MTASTARVLLTGLWLAGHSISVSAADPTLPIGHVEGQPLAANVLRVLEALQFLGSPLPAERTAAIHPCL